MNSYITQRANSRKRRPRFIWRAMVDGSFIRRAVPAPTPACAKCGKTLMFHGNTWHGQQCGVCHRYFCDFCPLHVTKRCT